jgi:hypothetical protein
MSSSWKRDQKRREQEDAERERLQELWRREEQCIADIPEDARGAYLRLEDHMGGGGAELVLDLLDALKIPRSRRD